MKPHTPKDFFISYTSTDRPWAEWIAWQLEHEGFSVVIQAWDFGPGGNFVLDMHKAATEAQRTIAVLSPNYFTALYTQSEWAAAFAQDPTGKGSLLLPVRIRECEPTGIFKAIVYIDLVGLDESTARERLLAGVKQERTKPGHAPLFPVTPAVTAPPRFPGDLPPLWNVPYQRNSFFTGREQVLTQLHNTLSAGHTTALTQPQAISGLGGIGKTQTAVEYAYRYQHDYDAILWIRAESRETLISDFVTLAHLLKLPEQQEQDQRLMVEAVKRWFHDRARWLLIFDNADDLIMTRDFLSVGGQGHILLTTRAQATGSIAQRIEVERMDPEEGTLFLLHRANILALDAPPANASQIDRLKASEIVQEMGGLPLALDQAGAFIEETQCGLSGYLQLYRTRQADLLKRRGKPVTDHPDSVATTWSLSFEKVEQANPGAADLLRLCAFLDPDAIPEEIISKGSPALGPVLRAVAAEPIILNEAIADLRTYSLVRRNPDHTFTIHRLVQAVLKQGMNASTRHRWAERAVQAVSHAFPEVDYNTWLHCQQYIPQVQTCANLIDQWNMTFPEATQLLMHAGNYLEKSAQYAQADPLYQRALAIREKILGPEHPDTATTLHALAMLYGDQGKYEQAEPLYLRALTIKEKMLGPEHPSTASTLHQLALLYWRQGKYEQAEPLYLRALTIKEKMLGPEHPDTAATLHALAVLYGAQSKYEQAEPLYLRALAISEKMLGPEHPSTGATLHQLAVLYWRQGKYEQAEPLYLRALAIHEKMLGPEHPDTAATLHALAVLYWRQGKYEQAEPLYLRALAIHEKMEGPEHPSTGETLHALAMLYEAQGKYKQAEPLLKRALAISEKVLGPEHPDTARRRKDYTNLLHLLKQQK